MTTNILELLDKALLDRLYPISFPAPDLDTVLTIARQKCNALNVKNYIQIEEEIRARPEEFKSVRAVERLVSEQYIKELSLTALEGGTRLGHPFFS